ncbi:hypothetical protein BGX33_006666 [Mortierella sp. NVP41]|nr:hypothetical protein BGX33_006666 [Mortierella sp. NVP41]
MSTAVKMTQEVTLKISHQDYPQYQSLRIFPRGELNAAHRVSINGSSLNSGNYINCTFEAAEVTKDGKYDFDIVLCTDQDLARNPVIPEPLPLKNADIIPLLLRDANSVDTCFMFTSDTAYSNVGLWAHRVVLSRHKVFAKLIQQQEELQALSANVGSDKDKDKKDTKFESDAASNCTVTAESGYSAPAESRSLVIKVDKFSLATFCALLYYIYTNEVHLSIDTERFAVTNGEGTLLWRDSTGHTRETVRWHPTNPNSPWKLKDVTWDELLEASDHYGISDLRTNCLTKVISGMNHSNVIGMLFSKSVSGSEVNEAAMEFIVKNWEAIFQKGKDPFAPYKEHPDCHDLLIELMQLKANKA